jgi:hypothetical protein
VAWLVTVLGGVMNHEMLRARVEEACQKISNYGIEGCEDREVTLACFGMLMFNGFDSIKKALNRAAWVFVSTLITTLVAIIIALIFV